MSAYSVSDQHLIASTLAGDTAAFDVLVRRHTPAVRAMVSRYLHGSDLVEDVVGKSFAQAYRKLSAFRGDSSFCSWVCTIAVRLAIDCQRAGKKASQNLCSLESIADSEDFLMVGDSVSVDPVGMLLRQDCKNIVRQAIRYLPLEQREVVELFHIRDMSYETISFLLDIPMGTVRSRLARARARLKERLCEYVEERSCETR
jgi:RNA polymerase sigma-70 factor (ECF subfamily)